MQVLWILLRLTSRNFLKEKGGEDSKAECYIPFVVDDAIQHDGHHCKVETTPCAVDGERILKINKRCREIRIYYTQENISRSALTPYESIITKPILIYY